MFTAMRKSLNTVKFNSLIRHSSGLRGAIVGCYKNEYEDSPKFTSAGKMINEMTQCNLEKLLKTTNFKADTGKTRSFYGLHSDYDCITVVGLGEKHQENDPNEDVDQRKENIRTAVGAGANELMKAKVNNIFVDDCADPSVAAEGVTLQSYVFDTYKSKKKERPTFGLLESNSVNEELWGQGLIVSNSQNFARELMETPSNYKYPLKLARFIEDRFFNTAVRVNIWDEVWAKEKKMNCFLSVGNGSTNPSVFLEMHYKGANTKPIVLVGKGITFDAGGISIKPSRGMASMRGDMGGAACVLATIDAVAALKVPVNLVVLVPLAENMPSGSATKPGDVFTAMNQKTVEVDNTDAEGRLVLADSLCYACEFNPSHIIDLATLTGAMAIALGGGATGTFTTDNKLWSYLHKAGHTTGDRMWRMPLYKHFTDQMKCSKTADLRNTQKKAGSAGACTAAAFLKEFVGDNSWAHLDIAGVMSSEGEMSYLPSGMSGRPTRTLIEAIRMLATNASS